eukprot:755238-Hanusia_phi.AAC.2
MLALTMLIATVRRLAGVLTGRIPHRALGCLSLIGGPRSLSPPPQSLAPSPSSSPELACKPSQDRPPEGLSESTSNDSAVTSSLNLSILGCVGLYMSSQAWEEADDAAATSSSSPHLSP